MLDYPTLTPENKSRDFIDVFGGYNHNPRIQDNEFFDMQNMTSSYYPLLATRDKRGAVPAAIWGGAGQITTCIRGMIYRSALYYIVFNFNDISHSVTIPFALRKCAGHTDTEIKAFSSGYLYSKVNRKLIMMGAYMIILPDKLYVNVEDPDDYGSIEAKIETEGGNSDKVTLQPCDADGVVFKINYVGSKVPSNYTNGTVWVDTSVEPAEVKRYDSESNTWKSVINQYVSIKATSTEISVPFKEGDGINISGVPTDFEGVSVIRKKPDDNSLVISGQFNDDNVKVFTPIDDLRSEYFVRVFCDASVKRNDYLQAHFLFRNKRILCNNQPQYGIDTANTAAAPYEYWVDKTNISLSSSGTGYIVSADTYQKWNSDSDSLVVTMQQRGDHEGFYDTTDGEESVIYVRIGEKKSKFNVFQYSHHSEGSDKITLTSINGSKEFFPNGVPPCAKLYPIERGDSKGLYETELYFPSDGIGASEKIVLEPDYKKVVDTPVFFSRLMPKMDFVVEAKNRLWGCRYGENNDGDVVNEIYACKLGDFKNWQVYEGVSTDSYAASCGTDGEWTGAINYLGYPVFFKENYIHTIYGSYPAQYQINSVEARGVQAGSSDSLAMMNEVLYYKSTNGIVAYTGSLPSQISAALGDVRYHDAIACAFNGKYYICMKDSGNAAHFFVYDTTRNLWHREDNLYVQQFCPVADDIYYLSSAGTLKSLFGSGGQDSNHTLWELITGIIGLSSPDHKYVSRINVRLSFSGAPANANQVQAYIQYDSSEDWENLHVGITGGQTADRLLQPYTLRIKPRRCDHFRLKLVGNGQVKIYSISKTIEQGSDVNYKSGSVR